ncbi:MAG TPA: hypothetical protein DDW27_10455 [Bacteroidales bacterium]|nr:hypothetical protein [Bacteroidales bacterium]
MKTKSEITLCFLLSILIFTCGCKKDDDKTLTDVDGNNYKTITIGGNVWMAENLRTTKFNDGSAIPLVTDAGQWPGLNSPAYCWFENNASNKNTLGGLYNGYAVKDSRGLCPTGWHVASDQDWIDLELSQGMKQTDAFVTDDRGVDENVGGHLKAITTWDAPNSGADNSSGFSALGTGYRRPPGEFEWFRKYSGFYTSSTSNPGYLWMRYLGHDMKGIARYERSLQYAYSIRCIKD